jgi:cation diffusion facilitator family transporter
MRVTGATPKHAERSTGPARGPEARHALAASARAAPDLARGQRLALAGLLATIGLATTKLVAGILGHSYALIADAIESMVDIVASVVIWGGLHIASKPADEDHPYGHGRAETVAAMIVAVLVGSAGLGIGIKAVHQVVSPGQTPARFTLWVLIAVIVVKLALFRFVRRAAREVGSGAMHVDAWHHAGDAITSVAALVGISAAILAGPGYAWADGAAALVAACVIILNGVLLVRAPLRDLMDTSPPDIVETARRTAAAVPGVVNVQKAVARKSGVQYWLDMHVRVDPQMTVRDSHALAHRVKDEVRAVMPDVADVLVHIEPA